MVSSTQLHLVEADRYGSSRREEADTVQLPMVVVLWEAVTPVVVLTTSVNAR